MLVETSDAYLIESGLRLLAAAGCGIVIGLNRDLKQKPMGMRTLGLVAVGAAVASLAALHPEEIRTNPDAFSRVAQGILQGVLTGIGFIGAGAVLKLPDDTAIRGLTTAAAVWATAALGIACALADWRFMLIAFVVTGIVLILPRKIARWGGFELDD
ncbi:magnesium transporter [Methylopila jiangsuensis]|uniref:Protein MgtC n=1 Tax=Methylopila jiangsuensis TaxID=586230 RepID=A0A9W6JI84_9HYPH|nr:MgtC/SapB family protein [Methylopila jiangsuensis]MDR6284249.1 putative Mg2+ transporter-C (MgtC) family protein [Methylopila jiangsuensis]GLK76234.1 magnesium transporter [Methylopila jiangsuensis]